MGMALLSLQAGGRFDTEIAQIVRETVRRHQLRGMKCGAAIESAARELGLSPRRVRSWFYQEPVALLAGEYFAIKARFAQHLAAEASRLQAEAKLLDARHAVMRSELG